MSLVVTAAEMRELDRITISNHGVPGAVLMENAGRLVADEAARRTAAGARVAVICGRGNNGGDGFVCARWLREWGRDARVVLVHGRPVAGGDAAQHLTAYEQAGGPIVELDAALPGAALVVDAIFGTGLSREVDAPTAQVIERMNIAPAPRLAVDVPSGLDSDRGRVMGACVRADVTVSFAYAKVGLVSWPGFELAGELKVVDIGIPHGLARGLGVRLELAEAVDMRSLVPRRARGGHKGTHGHLLVLAGSPGKSGAALLCSTAGLRAGAGLCTLATPVATLAALEGRAWEVMLAGIDYDRPSEDAFADLRALAAGKRALACGPGMPTTPAAGELLRRALRVLELPMVLDADALNHLAKDPSVLANARAPVILTPHPGEAARLLGTDTAAVQADRVGQARKLAAETRAIVVLKGARTVVAAPDGWAAINPTGNPGMGTAGSGDVLTGVVGGLLAQGLDPLAAARLGVSIHGAAGDRVAAERGEIGLIASDLLAALPPAFAALTS